MTAHWKETCGEAERARSFQDACNQACLRTVSLLCPSHSRRFVQGFLKSPKNIWECVASLVEEIQSENVLILLLDVFWPLCRTPTLHTAHIQLNHNWELLDVAFFSTLSVFKASNVNRGKHQPPLNLFYIIRLRATVRQNSVWSLFPVTHHLEPSAPNRSLQYKRIKLQVFVPQAGKTVFNQSTFILIIRGSFGVRCPHFETEETENKHGPPSKKNTGEFAPLCLSAWVWPTFTHTLTQVWKCVWNICMNAVFTFVNHAKHKHTVYISTIFPPYSVRCC